VVKIQGGRTLSPGSKSEKKQRTEEEFRIRFPVWKYKIIYANSL
jgi:hypothetical protein